MSGLLLRTGQGDQGVPGNDMRPLALSHGTATEESHRITDLFPAMGPQAKLIKRLYSLAEAGTYLGRSTWSIRRLIWSGELPSVRAGGRVQLDVQDMDAFIEQHKIQELP